MNRSGLYGIGLLCLALAPMGILRAAGITLDPADYYVQLDGSGPGSGPGQYSDGTSVAKLYTQPDPSVFVSTNGGSSLIELTYFFDVGYSLSDLPVEVIINAPQYLFANDAPLSQPSQWGMTSQITATAFDSSFNDYDYEFNSLDCFKVGGATNIVCPDGFIQYTPTQIKLEVLTNEEARISMNVAVNFPTGGTAEAYVDPYITFDPGFDATGYSLAFSDGISNDSPTPEPSTIVLSGFGLVAAWVARRRFGSRRFPT